MKTFDDLVKEFLHGTALQQDERFKQLVGEEIQIVGELSIIAPNYIFLWHHLSQHTLIPIHVKHEGEQFRKQLLEYANGDGVRLTARFTNIRHDEETTYEFDLTSIVKLNTREAREKEKQEAKEKKESSCFIATAAYGAPNPTVFLLQEYRDRILNKTIVGRAVVRFYYLMSPPLARFIEVSYRRRFITRVLFRPLVFVARRQLESSRKRERMRV